MYVDAALGTRTGVVGSEFMVSMSSQLWRKGARVCSRLRSIVATALKRCKREKEELQKFNIGKAIIWGAKALSSGASMDS